MTEFKYGLKQLRFISDPGHGWLEVPTADVEESGYIPSRYSYIEDQWTTLSWTYLEEDCDVAGFIQALGVAPDLVAPTVSYISYHDRTDSDSWVRDLPQCSGAGYVSPFAKTATARDVVSSGLCYCSEYEHHNGVCMGPECRCHFDK